MKKQLNQIFKANSVAVIGASNREHTVGYAVLYNIINGGFKGPVFAVNPNHNTIQGLKCFARISDLPQKVDLAVITTPAKTVKDVVEECGKAGVGGLVIISSGFTEAGKEGVKMGEDILKTARKYGMRFLGTNCFGFINPELKLNASFSHQMARQGRLALISQSGALCAAILDWAEEKNVGFSQFVSVGSMVDLGFHDLIDYLGNDPDTNSILIYMESLTNARKFLSAARAFARTKPLIVLKSGKSKEGAQSALSHTGSLAGNDRSFDAAFDRAGIIRVDTIEQLFDCAQALAMQQRPEGNRLAIVTNAGGPGVLATDYLMENGGSLAQLSEASLAKLNQILNKNWSHGNPVDILGDASVEQYRAAAETLVADENVDGVLAIFVPQAITPGEAVAHAIVEVSNKTDKTVLAAWMGERNTQAARDILEEGNVPVYKFPESAVYAFLKMYQYNERIKLLYETPPSIPRQFSPDIENTRKLIDKVVADGRMTFTELEAKQLMRYYGIPTTDSKVARDVAEVVAFAAELGYPLAMKISSPDISHKSDIGGVRINVRTEDEAVQAFDEILKNVKHHKPKARVDGILMEKMVKKRYEILIGANKDPIFGPVILFGMGGVATEIFKDNNIGLPPLNMALAMRMIEKTKIYELLKGFRNVPPVDLRAIQFLLYKFAYLVMEFPEIREIDLNPYVVDESGGMVLDAKVILDKSVIGKKIKPYSHLVISPYPRKYVREISLRDGRPVTLRPIRPEDEPEEAALFRSLSKETIYYRFFGFIPKLTHEMLARFTQIDYDREIAIVAEVDHEGSKKFAGVVRIVGDALENQAEFAIVVADAWQGQNLGNQMMNFILEVAKDRGFRKIYASVLKTNSLMIQMFKKRGFVMSSSDVETYRAELQI